MIPVLPEDQIRNLTKEFLPNTSMQILARTSDGETDYLLNDGGSVYRLVNAVNLKEELGNYMLDELNASLIPVEFIVELAEDIHLRRDFYTEVLNQDTTREELDLFNTALNSSINYNKDPEPFWHTIHRLSSDSLYPKCIMAMTEIFDFDVLKQELVAEYVDNGHEHLSEMQNGLFKTIMLTENTMHEEEIYYLYSIDSLQFETEQEEQKKVLRKKVNKK